MPGVASERRIVTALFCDLVGFASMSESADPEDIDRILGGYFAMARREIEGHGGTVEKFIGDAVVGIFGAPVSHVRVAVELGRIDVARSLLEDVDAILAGPRNAVALAEAQLDEAEGWFDSAAQGYETAAKGYEAMSIAAFEGHARLGSARTLLGMGRPADTIEAVRRARSIYERLGANPSIGACEQIEAAAMAATGVSPGTPA